MRAALALAAVLFTRPLLAAPAAPARDDALVITYRTETSVYLSAGRRAGLSVGERVAVMDEGRQVAMLEIAFVAEHSSSARVVEQSRPLRVGDRVRRLAGSRPAAEIAATPSAEPPAAVGLAGTRSRRPMAHLTGGVSAGWAGFRDASDAGRHVDERLARHAFSLREVGGQPVELTVRGSHRQSERERLRTTIVPASERFDRLYEAAVAWTPATRTYAVRAGRLGASPFTTLGYLDGVLAELRPTAALALGGFAGRTAHAQDFGLAGGAKYGAFLRMAPSGRTLPYSLVLSGVSEEGDLGRRYLGQEGHVRAGRWWVHERMEVDFGTGAAPLPGGSSVRLSEARLLASWRPSDARALTVSYERRRPLWNARPGVFALDGDNVQQTLRADLDLVRRGAGPWVGGSLRLGESDQARAWSVHAGARSPELFALATSAEASAYQTRYTRGLGAFLRAGRDLRGGHSGQVSYVLSVYELRLAGERRHHHLLRLSGYGRLTRGAYARADLEYGMGDDMRGLRAMVEAGYRF